MTSSTSSLRLALALAVAGLSFARTARAQGPPPPPQGGPMGPGGPGGPGAPPGVPSGSPSPPGAPADQKPVQPPKPKAPPRKAEAPQVARSTSSAEGPTVDDLYKGQKLKDPFQAEDAGGAGAPAAAADAAEAVEEFSIHSLTLRGIMEDKSGAFAVLVWPKSNASYVLKKGKLYDIRNHTVPGVTGAIKPKQKTVELMTEDKDVQVFVLGEDQNAGEGDASQP